MKCLILNFDHFTIENLCSTVRESGLYPSDKIIERMKQLSDEIQQDLENKREQLKDAEQYLTEQLEELEEEKKEVLSVKDQEINKLRKEKKALEEDLKRKAEGKADSPDSPPRQLKYTFKKKKN